MREERKWPIDVKSFGRRIVKTGEYWRTLLALRVAAVAAEVAAAGVFELAMALGADADHV